ncbi:hypothetical protein [Kiloniella sp.]|uniref:hypothetical protein n=1 Tax=Kiloniella sp. TaxID=1938587 RepID=UPI003B02A808
MFEPNQSTNDIAHKKTYTKKNVGIALALLATFGALGFHRHYLGRHFSGSLMAILFSAVITAYYHGEIELQYGFIVILVLWIAMDGIWAYKAVEDNNLFVSNPNRGTSPLC